MGWQDRDYARQPTTPMGASFGRVGLSRPRSIVTILIIVNVAVYAVPVLFPPLGAWIFGFGAMQADAVLHGHFWRLVTAQYLHAGTWHLAFNMIGLHFLGRPLERMWSPRKFFTIYTLCGVFGNIFFTILGSSGVINPMTPAVGASGSIFGLLGIVAVLFPTATVYIYFLFPIKIRTAAMIYGGIAVFSILSRGHNFGGEACHLAGLVFGVWWAMKGETWWASTHWRLPGWTSRSKPRRGGRFQANVKQRRDDAETVDRILRKVYEGGVHTLSAREKRALQEASARQQDRERKADRADRL